MKHVSAQPFGLSARLSFRTASFIISFVKKCSLQNKRNHIFFPPYFVEPCAGTSGMQSRSREQRRLPRRSRSRLVCSHGSVDERIGHRLPLREQHLRHRGLYHPCGQMVAILYRYAQFKSYDVSTLNNLSGYADASQISAYATTTMQ